MSDVILIVIITILLLAVLFVAIGSNLDIPGVNEDKSNKNSYIPWDSDLPF